MAVHSRHTALERAFAEIEGDILPSLAAVLRGLTVADPRSLEQRTLDIAALARRLERLEARIAAQAAARARISA